MITGRFWEIETNFIEKEFKKIIESQLSENIDKLMILKGFESNKEEYNKRYHRDAPFLEDGPIWHMFCQKDRYFKKTKIELIYNIIDKSDEDIYPKELTFNLLITLDTKEQITKLVQNMINNITKYNPNVFIIFDFYYDFLKIEQNKMYYEFTLILKPE